MSLSAGQILINHHIPDAYKIGPNSSPKEIQSKFESWAHADPSGYSDKIPEIKRIGDQITMYEGLSVGMDDLNPMKKEREVFLKPYEQALSKAKTDEHRKKILIEAVQNGAKESTKGVGSLVDMFHTGTKGNSSQLMKNIFSPITASESDNTPYPYLINKSYSEGLTPGQYWVSSIEARNAVISTKTATAEPGDLGKQLFNSLNTMVVSTNDCGTLNGIYMPIDDHNIVDRYLAKDYPTLGKRNTLITSKIIDVAKKQNVKEIMVRSPITCEARNGVCQLCYGLNPMGKLHTIGTNVGTIAAQSLSEPLTQMMLKSKHGVVLSGKTMEDTGMIGVKKLLTKPKIFPNKATLAQLSGKVTKITKAPQGGFYVYINDMEHYVPIDSEVIVKNNQQVLIGDSLSDGLKDPREFTTLRGLGSGRSYMYTALYNAYNPLNKVTGERTGLPIDKRHIEVLVKKDMNHVIIDEHNDTFSRGDIVEYNKLKEYLSASKKEVPIDQAIGEYLGREYLFYTVGSEVTPHMITTLKNKGINKVIITERKIKFSPYVTSLRTIPLLKGNFIGRLPHREIKQSLIDAATMGQTSEIHSYDPVHSFIRGVEFGEAADGQY
jgi:DNA-directed RNA polymerase subunit beta'